MHSATRPLPEDATVHYLIDTQGSAFTVQAFSSGLLAAFGHNLDIAVRDFEGSVEFVPSPVAVKDARLIIRMKADSLEVTNDISKTDRDEIHRRMYGEVLETDQYPEIVYECSRVTGSGSGDRYWLALNGNLTLHGVTHALVVSPRVVVTADSLRASGEFLVRLSDYQIAPVTAVAGAVRIKDELRCTFDIVARRQG